MSSQVLRVPAIDDLAARGERPTRLSGRWLVWARTAWLVIFILCLGLFIISLPPRFEDLMNVCIGRDCSLSPEQSLALQEMGLSARFYATYTVVLEIFYVLGYAAIAFIIFWRRSHEWLGIFVSVALIAFGTTAFGTMQALARTEPEWSIPVWALTGIGLISVLILAYIFPDGRFIPRVTKYLSIIWIIWMIPWYIPPRVLFTITDWTYPLWFVILLVWFATAMVAQIYRYRRVSDRAQQLQTKWVVLGMIASVSGYFGATFPFVLFPTLARAGMPAMQYELVRVLLTDLTALLLPIALGIAILRYGLWNIDLIINRAVLYASLTAILAGLYAASITLSQKMFVALTGEASDAAIVLTTLVIVSAATPLKERLETIVDKRFRAPTHRLSALRNQVLTFVQMLDVEQLVSRLLDDAVATFDAVSGAVYLEKDGEQRLVHTCGLWTGEARLTVPLETNNRQLGLIAIGRRRDGTEYSARDRASLGRTAFLISRAIELVERKE